MWFGGRKSRVCEESGGLGVNRSLGRFQARSSAWCDLIDVRLVGADANAGSKVVWLDFHQWRHNLLASLNHVRATGVKAAALRRIDRRGHIAFQHDSLTSSLYNRIGNGHRGD